MQLNLTTFVSVNAAREWARNEIDAAAGRARARYITIAPGQSETYAAKYQQALAYIASGCPADLTTHSWIAHESESTGRTPAQAADIIKATGDAWNNVIGPRIEGLRVGGKSALVEQTTQGEILTSARSTIVTLDGI